MTLTLITPTFNSALTLEETLRSVACQTLQPYEHLIIDGASKDGTLDIAARYRCSVFSKPDRGIYDAMNKGVLRASGDIVGILNSDDCFAHPEVLRMVVETMMVTGADALYADLDYVSDGKVVRRWRTGKFERNSFLNGWMPPHPTFFVRREVYERYGGFNDTFKISADYEFMLRVLFLHGVSVCYLPEVTVLMKAGGVSNGSWRNRLQAHREDRLAWRLNGLKPRFYTLWWKPLRKVHQFTILARKKSASTPVEVEAVSESASV